MSAEDLTISDIDAEIEIVRQKILELTEEAVARTGGANQFIAARQRTEQEFKLSALLAQREALEASYPAKPRTL